MPKGWKRIERTTRGADPTTGVTWVNDAISVKVVEFQGVYQTETPSRRLNQSPIVQAMGEAMHKAFEDCEDFAAQIEEFNKTDEQRELEDQVETAERKAGWDPNP